MFHIAWLGKKSPFCGNVSYGNSTTKELKERGYKISFIHFANTHNSGRSHSKIFENDTDISLPYLIKSQIYTIPSLKAQKRLRLALQNLRPDIMHASLTLSPLDFNLSLICRKLNIPLMGTFHPAFDKHNRNLTASLQRFTYKFYAHSLSKFQKIIVFSESQKDILKKFGVSEKKQIIIPNGVDQNI